MKAAIHGEHIKGGSLPEAEIEPPNVEELINSGWKRKSSDGSFSRADSLNNENAEVVEPVKRVQIMDLIDKIVYYC